MRGAGAGAGAAGAPPSSLSDPIDMLTIHAKSAKCPASCPPGKARPTGHQQHSRLWRMHRQPLPLLHPWRKAHPMHSMHLQPFCLKRKDWSKHGTRLSNIKYLLANWNQVKGTRTFPGLAGASHAFAATSSCADKINACCKNV
jgi:hypothetical protein